MHKAYIVEVKELRQHSNADRLLVATFFGNDTIVSTNVKVGDVGIYFPTDGRLSKEFAEENKLLRSQGGYLEDSKRHISTIKLRGERSDGLYMSLDYLKYFGDTSQLKVGDTIDIFNGKLICEKYIVVNKNQSPQKESSNKTKEVKEKVKFPTFKEHIDTAHFSYNTHVFKKGDLITISLKQHGSSSRVARLESVKHKKIPYFLYKILSKMHMLPKPIVEYKYVSGSRRVVLTEFNNSGFYNDNSFRKKWHDFFVGKLHKGETVYGEIVGYINETTSIMPSVANSKTKDKEFIKQYGETTTFNYGCAKGENEFYVYRMTMTNEDGIEVEYSTSQIINRCEQMGVKHLMVLDQFIFDGDIEALKEKVSTLADGVDPIGKTHIKEGVVVRIENRPKFTAYKHKSFLFKVLEGIIKSEDVPDIEDNS